ncbi:MAG: DNA translocase FtsK [Neisseriales bacterium]|nr:MAG: DNA translocase FtsK [Neisseriales bacterium]
MKQTKTKFARRNRETILPSKLAQLINDIIAIILFAISLMLFLALATHSPNDNAWSKTIDSPVVYNKLGVIGAYISDIVFYIFGMSAWWLILGIFYLGCFKISRKKFNTGNWTNIYQIVSFIFLVAASSVFEYITFYGQPTTLPDGMGGSFGGFLFSIAYHFVGEVGVAVISLLVMITAFSFAFAISWVTIAERIGAGLEYVYLGLAGLVERKEEEMYEEPHEVTEKKSFLGFKRKTKIDEDTEVEPEFTHKLVDYEEAIEEKANKSSSKFRFLKEQKDEELSIDEEIYNNSIDEDEIEEFVAHQPKHQEAASDLDFLARLDNVASEKPASINNEEIIPKPLAKKPVIVPKLHSVDLLAESGKKQLPATMLLNLPKQQAETVSPETIEYVSNTIENTLAEFGVEVKITNVESGPVITRYELIPPKGVRGDKITGLAKEIARSLALPNVRVVETIPGKNSMGIEVPNFKRQVIYLKEIFDSGVYRNNSSLLTLALGKDIAGDVIVTDLAKMPHLLVAGTTGSGKSVAVNGMILSILFNATPDEVKFIMIDPKMVELSFYQDIPHLLAPVVTDMSQAANALKWTVGEMEQRYRIMAKIGTKNIVTFNQKVEAAISQGSPINNPLSIDPSNPEPLSKWPYIVVIIDELADLMMVAGKKIEQYIARIAQKARAVGIHLIVATQRPSVDVITGLIKANIPARVSFQVSSKIDSRTILDQMGAETLLGQGDMLFLNPGSGVPRRIHGAFVNDDELHKVVEFLKSQGAPDYNDDILTGASEVTIPGFEEDSGAEGGSNIEKDSVFDEAVKFILASKRCSISSLQTQFGIGYNKAARIMSHLEKIGMVRRNERGGFELLNQPSM